MWGAGGNQGGRFPRCPAHSTTLLDGIFFRRGARQGAGRCRGPRGRSSGLASDVRPLMGRAGDSLLNSTWRSALAIRRHCHFPHHACSDGQALKGEKKRGAPRSAFEGVRTISGLPVRLDKSIGEFDSTSRLALGHSSLKNGLRTTLVRQFGCFKTRRRLSRRDTNKHVVCVGGPSLRLMVEVPGRSAYRQCHRMTH